MKKILTLIIALTMAAPIMSAQGVDRSFVFIDENGTEIEDGATVVRNSVQEYEEGGNVIYSGLKVQRTASSTSNYLRMHYTVEQIDNGAYQLCFPTTCNQQTVAGEYVTATGGLMTNPQDIQSEWFPTGDGNCTVKLSIEVMKSDGKFPPQYVHMADGPTLTLTFTTNPGGDPIPGDVNGDGNVNVGDINYIIDRILNPRVGDLSADVNGDGNVNIGDINAVIGIILE